MQSDTKKYNYNPWEEQRRKRLFFPGVFLLTRKRDPTLQSLHSYAILQLALYNSHSALRKSPGAGRNEEEVYKIVRGRAPCGALPLGLQVQIFSGDAGGIGGHLLRCAAGHDASAALAAAGAEVHEIVGVADHI